MNSIILPVGRRLCDERQAMLCFEKNILKNNFALVMRARHDHHTNQKLINHACIFLFCLMAFIENNNLNDVFFNF